MRRDVEMSLEESAIRTRLREALEEYYAKLSSSAAVETDPGASSLYEGHLYRAQKLRDVLASDGPLASFRHELSQGQRDFGWSFLTGANGDAVEAAFNALVRLFDQLTAAGGQRERG